jgi:parallel beta-helix repeat protein
MSKHLLAFNKTLKKLNRSSVSVGIRVTALIIIVAWSLVGMSPASVSAAGSTYYVNNINPAACSDSGPGTIAAPYCTITKGASMASVPGDTVIVLAGTYAETVFVNFSGTAANPITFQGNPGVTVTGDSAGFGSAFAVSTKSYVVIDGFNITETAYKGIYVDSSNHITISNNHVTYAGIDAGPDQHQQGIFIRNTTYSTITGNTTDHNSCIGIRLINNSNYNVISDNISFANSSAIAYPVVAVSDAAGIELTGSSNNTVVNNITYGNEDTGINLYVNSTGVGSSYNVVVGNLSYGNGDHGIDNNNSPYNTIVGNTVQGNGTTGINFEGDTGAGSHHATVANNIVSGNGLTPPSGSFGGNLRVDSASIAGTTVDYQLFHKQAATVQIIWNDNNYATLAAFRAVAPTQEVHGVEGDPLFFVPVESVLRTSGVVYPSSDTTGDYHIGAGSPAIDSANSDAPSQMSVDIEGTSRVDDPDVTNTGAGTRAFDDRGAYEFVPHDYPPVVTTQAVTNIATTTATGNGNVILLGVPDPTQHGVVWSVSANPTIADNKTTDGPVGVTGAFTSSITGLIPGAQYHVRAYATNSMGTAYGNDVVFTTSTGTGFTDNTPGTRSWIVPVGVTSITVEVWGGGGRGGSISGGFGESVAGGGGGGGYSSKTITVVPGTSYSYTVGSGSSSTSPGGDSYFINTATLLAKGGSSSTGSSGASGGAAASGVGDTKYSGGTGAGGSTGSNYGGGGGSSAGTGANGANATNATGANAPTGGGNGGDGRSSSSGNGTAGSTPGGAGGGAYRSSLLSSYNGGNGAAGQIRITYAGGSAMTTTTTVDCGAGAPTLTYGASITCVATVTAASGSNSPTGSVSWTTGGAGSFATSPCTVSGSGGASSCSVTYTPSAVDGGSHLIYASYQNTDGNFLLSNGYQYVTVNPKALTMSGLTVPSGKIYDATTVAVVSGAPALQASEPLGSGTIGDGKPYTGDAVSITGTAVGAYNSKDVLTAATVTFSGLSLTGAQAGNYTLTIQSPAAATITAKALTMSGLSVPASKVYNATTVAVVSGSPALQAAEAAGTGTTGDGKPYSGDTVSIAGTATGTYNSKDVATATTVTYGGLSLAGAQAGNYTLTIQSPVAATITAKALTMSGLSIPASKVYNGTNAAAVTGTAALQATEAPGAGTSSDGKPYTGDAVSITGTPVGTYPSKNVGASLPITLTGLSLNGAQAGNYTLTLQSLTSAITAKPITVTAIMNAKLYDGLTTAASIPTNTGVVSGDTANFIEAYNNKHVGFNTKTLIPSGTVTDGNNGNNYSYTFVNFTTGTITAMPITVTAVTNTKVYDGSTTAAAIPTNTGVIAGDTPNFTETYANKNVGAGNKTLVPAGIVSDGNGGNNYTYTFVNFTTGSITAKPITVTAITNTRVYDGATSAAAIPTNSGVAAGDTASFIEAYADKNVGAGNKTLVPTGTVSDGNSGNNYSYTFVNFTTGTITPKAASVTPNAGAKVYGETDPALTGTLAGFIAADNVTAVYNRAVGETVTGGPYVISATLSPSGALSNYNITYNTASFTIIPRPLAVAGITANNKPYDGNTVASLNLGSAALQGALGGDDVTLNTSGATGAFSSANVGTWTVTVSGLTLNGTAKSNYSIIQPTTTASIIGATVTVTGVVANDKVYNGSNVATLNFSGANLVGIVPGDSVSLNTSGASATFADEIVGVDKAVTITGLALSGSDAGKYQLVQPSASADITPRGLTVSATASDKVYDGTTAATVDLVTNALVGDVVTVTYSAANFDTKNVGVDKTVTVTGLALGGADAGNYNLLNASANALADITPHSLTVTADNATMVAGSVDPTFTYTVNGFIAPDTFVTAPTCSIPVPHAVVGSYDIVCAGGDAGANYSISYEDGILTVTAANNPPTDIALSNTSVVENLPVGTTVGALTATDADAGDTHTFSLACAAPGANDGSFQIVGSDLKTAAVFDYETKNSYAICIRVDDGHGGTFDENFVITVTDVVEKITLTVRSVSAQDGWVLESTETSEVGGTKDNTATTFNLGDDASDRQYRSIVSFNTSALPDNAVIKSVTLKIRKQSVVGTDPFTTHGGLMAEIVKPYFGTNASLVIGDFEALANKVAGWFNITPVNNWYSVTVGSASYPYVNLTGTTQFRLRFQKGDNDNGIADIMRFFSGDYGTASARPTLVIEYTVP